MYEFTPNASWTTITAPRASPSGRASYSDIGPSVVSSSMVRVSTDAPSVLGGGVEGGAQLGDEPSRLLRSSAGQHPPHERAPDYHTVGRLRSRHGLLRRRDSHAEQDGHVAGRLAAATHLDRLTGEGRPLAGDAHQRHAVYEAARPIADGTEAIVGGRRRREQHGFDTGGVGGVPPIVELVQRQVGNDRAVDPGVGE